MSINNDPKPGRLRTSTDERSLKLVADAHEEDLRAHVKNFLEPLGAKLSQENAQEPTSVTRVWAIHSR